ncbi:hydroxyisourate hydrolase [Halosquirtibacter xylanolyticus]|uniref:hydroxyisourate hydrolase n=1 Tax=Halosquirtibacter xylanolyticus TaxID=3374599 RepID=UPI00374A4C9E|nr:hydroxyisourate hydrolase [Prolixibacteraceae bacterium]
MKYMFLFIIGIFSLMTLNAQTKVEDNTTSSPALIIEVKDFDEQKPIEKLRIRLSNLIAIQNKWQFLDEQVTNREGVINQWDNTEINGLIELKIYIADFFRQRNEESIFPYIIIHIYKEKLKSNRLKILISKDAYSIEQQNITSE